MGVYIQHTARSKIELIASSSENIAHNVFQQVMNLVVDFNEGGGFEFDQATVSVVSKYNGYAKLHGRVVFPDTNNYMLAVGNFGCMFEVNGNAIGDSLSHFRFAKSASTRVLSVPSMISIVRVSVGDKITMHANHEEGVGVLVPTYMGATERTGFYVERV